MGKSECFSLRNYRKPLLTTGTGFLEEGGKGEGWLMPTEPCYDLGGGEMTTDSIPSMPSSQGPPSRNASICPSLPNIANTAPPTWT